MLVIFCDKSVQVFYRFQKTGNLTESFRDLKALKLRRLLGGSLCTDYSPIRVLRMRMTREMHKTRQDFLMDIVCIVRPRLLSNLHIVKAVRRIWKRRLRTFLGTVSVSDFSVGRYASTCNATNWRQRDLLYLQYLLYKARVYALPFYKPT